MTTDHIRVPVHLDGNRVDIYAERVDRDVWILTDRGAAARVLSSQGIDVDTPVVARSWESIVDDLRLSAPSRVLARHEVVGQVSTADLQLGFVELARTLSQCAALRALRPGHVARDLGEVILAAAAVRHLSLTPHASMPTRYGGHRAVTVRINGDRHWYVHAITRGALATSSYDEAQSVLASAAVPKDRRVVIVANDVDLEGWQWRILAESGIALRECQLAEFFNDLASSGLQSRTGATSRN